MDYCRLTINPTLVGVLVAVDIKGSDINYRCYRRYRVAEDEAPLDANRDENEIIARPQPESKGGAAQHMATLYRPLCWVTDVMRLDLEDIFECPDECGVRLMQVPDPPPFLLSTPQAKLSAADSCPPLFFFRGSWMLDGTVSQGCTLGWMVR